MVKICLAGTDAREVESIERGNLRGTLHPACLAKYDDWDAGDSLTCFLLLLLLIIGDSLDISVWVRIVLQRKWLG